ncbi:unnamed protein product [Notodromas monacha]|uniref:Spaetzle domain-containing protein n=1 Tax=Notodromas monacha TaxID=399045 RepID=A0A7R9GAY4_9CRUS|nr:unnamed protein product [Notodromas monacha]CAG0915945.1 unnamed protein product [Notodromas monacha]
MTLASSLFASSVALLVLQELFLESAATPVDKRPKQMSSGPFIIFPSQMFFVDPRIPVPAMPIFAQMPTNVSVIPSASGPPASPVVEVSTREIEKPSMDPPAAPVSDELRIPTCKNMIGDSICLDLEEYPEEKIITAVRNTLNEIDADLILTTDSGSQDFAKNSPDYDLEPFDFRNKGPTAKIPQEGIGPSGGVRGIAACRSQEAFIRPRMMRNENNAWRYIVNGKRYLQELRVETCVYANNDPCQNFGLEPFSGRQGVCRQKYILRRLLAVPIHGGGGNVFKESFPIPSCCACFLE